MGMAWRDVQAIPAYLRQGLLQLFTAGVFGWGAEHRREYSTMQGFNALVNTIAKTANAKNNAVRLPKFQRVFPLMDRMMRLGVSRAALLMNKMNKERLGG